MYIRIELNYFHTCWRFAMADEKSLQMPHVEHLGVQVVPLEKCYRGRAQSFRIR